MTTIQLRVPDDLQTKATAQAAANGYASVDEYFADLLRADTSGPDDQATERLLLHRASAPVAGEMTDADFDAIRARVRQTAAHRPKL